MIPRRAALLHILMGRKKQQQTSVVTEVCCGGPENGGSFGKPYDFKMPAMTFVSSGVKLVTQIPGFCME